MAITASRRQTRGVLTLDRWFFLSANAAGGPNTAVSPPEFDIAIGNAVNVNLTLEITGVGAACSPTTGPSIAAECAVAATDLPAAYKTVGNIVDHVDRKRYSASIVFGENNANLSSRYARGSMRLKLTNTDVANPAFVRVRLWVDLEAPDGSHIDVPIRSAGTAGGVTPFLWCDEVLLLDPTGGPGTSHFTLSAAQVLPMRDKIFAGYTVEYAVFGTGTATLDFERTIQPTEIDAAWQPMTPAALAMAAPNGYITKTFAADGSALLAPRGYQRPHFRNTDAANWVAVRARIWAHLA